MFVGNFLLLFALWIVRKYVVRGTYNKTIM